MMPGECPCCRTPLTDAKFGPVPIRVCLSCAGAWFNQGQLQRFVSAGSATVWKLSDHLRASLVRAAPKPAIEACPACHLPLESRAFPSLPGVQMAVCPPCRGYWLSSRTMQDLALVLTREEQRHVDPDPPKLRSRDPSKTEALNHVHAPAEMPVHVKKRCPECEQPNDADAAVCWACGCVIGPRTTGTCPRCLGSRQSVECGGVAVEICTGCGGAWIQEGRLSALRFQDASARSQLLKEAQRLRSGRLTQVQHELLCPRCELLLLAKPIGMLTRHPILTCPQCTANFIDFHLLPEFLDLDPIHPPAHSGTH